MIDITTVTYETIPMSILHTYGPSLLMYLNDMTLF